ncbi:hypothetical protein L1987_61027 [Smallanthus sonchifolius]|uniref:Uncharacterized protein n=1 Tax=Smallanthus sonchifolius TaxID=185202 RepID=A0ACB9DA18_9ASTR|nr:hypothetical protein L1987_61027 [Smallanthus sonchifolius]
MFSDFKYAIFKSSNHGIIIRVAVGSFVNLLVIASAITYAIYKKRQAKKAKQNSPFAKLRRIQLSTTITIDEPVPWLKTIISFKVPDQRSDKVLLTTILIVVYNCSDQVISTWYEKQAKSREAAAKYARETAQQRQVKNFKRCLETVRITVLQETLSWTFSRTKTKSSAGPMNSHVNKKEKHWIDDNLENDKSLNLENGDKNMNTKHARKASKEFHTRS